ncbi:DEAD/DEAH box helicase [Pseudactinotalea sp. HY158]|uniref:DEAD/DEAH box helicase n=1 Tax=Pseudactinotalea sp. HY158 TaxID=2654547 RepID=UPI00129C3AD5|nr:DEAD/DEAH box helicase [Pseudactinotalea sp. HY158]QGH71084.1 ATP-dependent helicase [Pseudactinotalea sp. HY158]
MAQRDGAHGAARDPGSPSASAASNLSPAYPARAAWGTAGSLRAWQAAALAAYLERQPRDFLAVATPGAGKTTFALRVAAELIAAGVIRRIAVVAPTEHLKTQWADAAARVGIMIDPNFRNAQGRHGAQFTGVALTYAQVAANPALHRARTEAERTLVILDEVHHGGDALTWGDGIREAFDPATRRLSLTGTPFRSDTAPIPFITYTPDSAGIRRSQADHTYGYSDALRDGVVRPVLFMSYSGAMRWRTRVGDEMSASLGTPMTKDLAAQAWRTALDPQGEWIQSVLAAADRRLTEVRRGMPDAGGLVIATDQDAARAYAAHLRRITGEAPVVVLSDDPSASKNIEVFNGGDQRWMVAVRMVSEGVDVPRLAVGVYATATATPLFFAQAVGRFVRARRRGETASIFLPSVPVLLGLAGELEAERDHALDRPEKEGDGLFDDEALAEANRAESASSDLLPGFAALEANASFDRVLFDGGEFGLGGEVGSEEEQDFLGIPGLLDPDQVATLLRSHQAEHAKRRPAGSPAQAGQAGQTQSASPAVDHRKLAELRKELNSLVSAWARRSGSPHGVVHTRLREHSGGAEVATASQEHLEKRIAQVRRWFLGKK